MELKVILNHLEKYRSFVYSKTEWGEEAGIPVVLVHISPRANGRPVCSKCDRPGSIHDTALKPRWFMHIPLLTLTMYLVYRMRRVNCSHCGVVVEKVPWADGKKRVTTTFAWYLARWAKRMSWQDVANVFSVSWSIVYRAVETAVRWGLEHRDLSGICSIGVDEVLFHKGHKYLTVVYQIDEGCKRLLWVGEHRTVKTLLRFFRWFGPELTQRLQFICSDMWKPYLKVIAYKAAHALNVLDRFHIVAKINKAIDAVRAQEAKEMADEGRVPLLKHSRWCFLKNTENLTERQDVKLRDLLRYNLKSVRAYLLKQDFKHFWEYVSPYWARWFFDRWCIKVMRSRIEPLKAVACSMRNHKQLIMNWFKAKNAISLGAVEGLNNKEKVVMRNSYGFRTFKIAEIALYHKMGALPEPEFTHRF